MSTAKNFYDKRLKKVLFEQLKKKSQNQGGLNPPFQNSGGGCDPPNPPPPCLAPVLVSKVRLIMRH